MARGRIISPDFWSDSTIVGLSPLARLFYIGTWNFTYCDKGHLPDDSVGLKLKILPADQIDANDLLEELLNAGRIVRITVDGKSFLFIPTFATHQTASKDSRWATRCPVCKLSETLGNSGEFLETLDNSPKLSVEGRGEESSGVEGRGRPPRHCSTHPGGTTTKCIPCKEARLRQEDWDAAQKNKPTAGPPRKADLCPDHEWNLKKSCTLEHETAVAS